MKRTETVPATDWLDTEVALSPQRAWLTSAVGSLDNVRSYLLSTTLPAFKEEAWYGLNNFVLNPIDKFFISFFPDQPLFRSLSRSGAVLILTAALSFTILNQALPMLLIIGSAFSLQVAASTQLEREEFLEKYGIERHNVASSQFTLVTGVFSLVEALKFPPAAWCMAIADMSKSIQLGIEINYREELKKAVDATHKRLNKLFLKLIANGDNSALKEQLNKSMTHIVEGLDLVEDKNISMSEKYARLKELQQEYSSEAKRVGQELTILRKDCELLQKKLGLEGSFEEVKMILKKQLAVAAEEKRQVTRNQSAFQRFIGVILPLAAIPIGALLALKAPVHMRTTVLTIGTMVTGYFAQENDNADGLEISEMAVAKLTPEQQDLMEKLITHCDKEAEIDGLKTMQGMFTALERLAELNSKSKDSGWIQKSRQLVQTLDDIVQTPIETPVARAA
jgi:ABC-type multidrug transport system fused ATPase/permease subunit